MGIREGIDENAATPRGRAVEDTTRLKDCMGCKVVRYCGKVSAFWGRLIRFSVLSCYE